MRGTQKGCWHESSKTVVRNKDSISKFIEKSNDPKWIPKINMFVESAIFKSPKNRFPHVPKSPNRISKIVEVLIKTAKNSHYHILGCKELVDAVIWKTWFFSFLAKKHWLSIRQPKLFQPLMYGRKVVHDCLYIDGAVRMFLEEIP